MEVPMRSAEVRTSGVRSACRRAIVSVDLESLVGGCETPFVERCLTGDLTALRLKNL